MAERIKWHTEKRKLSELKPCKWNPRNFSEKQYADLDKSLTKFNLADPIIINTNNEICGGHFRYKILKDKNNGKDLIVDIRVPNRKLTDDEMRELNIRLNKNTGEFNFDLLANFDEALLTNIGFGSEELDKIFQLDQSEQDDDDVPEERKTNIKRGDMFQLGKNRLLCGDATSKEDIAKLMGDEKAELVFTSPPYNMAGAMYENYEDNLKSEEYIDFNIKVIENIKPFLKGFIFWNISYNKKSRWEFIEIIYRIIKETGLKFLELIIWDKGHALPITSKEGLTRQYEDILLVGNEENINKDLELYFCGRNDRRAYFNKKTQKGITNYWRIGTNKVQIKGNLACFPVALPRKGIELMTKRQDVVLEPFSGSGSTLIACEKTNRICHGMEIDCVYVDVIIRRWEKYTGKKAKKIS